MGRPCQICSHPSRLEIDKAILAGQSLASIGRDFGFGSESVGLHRDRHLTRQLLKSNEVRELVNLDTLAQDVSMMRERCLDVLQRAKKKNWLNTELKALGELRATYQFLAGLAMDLERMKQGESKTSLRLEAAQLRQNLSKDELEFLAYLLEKASVPIETN